MSAIKVEKVVKSITENIQTLRDPSEIFLFLTKIHNIDQRDAKAIAVKIVNASRPPFIDTLELFLTENCNLRCDYCFVKNKSNERMSEEIVKKAIEFLLKESKDKRDLTVVFFGGEPLLEFELIRTVTIYAEDKARNANKIIRFTMTTNGTLFNEESLSFCREHNIRFLVSIDGDKQSHDKHRKAVNYRGSFNLLEPKLSLIKSYQPWLGARVTVTPDNAAKLVNNIEFLVSKKFNQFIIGPAEGVDWSKKDLNEYREQMVKLARYYKQFKREKELRMEFFDQTPEIMNKKVGIRGCRAGRNSVAISVSGEIYPCSMFLGIDHPSKLAILGNINEGITKKEKRSEFTKCILHEGCLECDYLFYCRGGCPGNNYCVTGSPFIPSYQECLFAKLNVDIRREILEKGYV